MKVIFVVPDSVNLLEVHPSRTLKKAAKQPPLGLLYVAAAVEEAGHDVIILDNYLEERPVDEIVERIIAERPDCIGYTATIMNIRQAFAIAREVKAALPEPWNVFGGPQPTIDPFGTLDRDGVDCVVRGEGEIAMVELLESLSGKAVLPADIPGVLYKWPDGRVDYGPEPLTIQDLSRLPRPARDLIRMNRYERTGAGLHNYPVDVISTSRGCSFQCAFCSSAEYWNRRYRMRPPRDVVDEMETMKRRYGTRGFYFREDNFTLSRKHVLGICGEIKRRRLRATWECESRVDTLSRDVMARMVDAGCRAIWCGVESGSQRILDLIAKGTTVEKAREFYANARELGITTGASFMIGIPGESEQDIKHSMDLALELGADYTGFLSYVAFPGSPMYERVCSEGLYSSKYDAIRFVDTELLPRRRVLELEQELNRKLRLRKAIRRPVRTISSAIRSRLNRKLHFSTAD